MASRLAVAMATTTHFTQAPPPPPHPIDIFFLTQSATHHNEGHPSASPARDIVVEEVIKITMIIPFPRTHSRGTRFHKKKQQLQHQQQQQQ